MTTTASPLPQGRLDALTTRVRELMPQVRADLETLTRIPSVSLGSFPAERVVESAEAVRALLAAEGMDVRVVSHGGHPAVIGRKAAAREGTPTVLLYAHHDVQPPGEDAEWDTPVWEPTERDGRLYARGVADDKAGVMAHVAALRAHGEELPVNVVVFVEGEEEVGSASLERILTEHRDELACDAIVLADSSNWAVGRPALTTTLRGLVRVTVTTRALEHGVHSGMYGGPAIDGITAMCRLLATLHDEKGDVAVRGLDAGEAADLDYPEDAFRADAGVSEGVQLIGSGSIVSRLWTRPTATVIGMDVPSVDTAANLMTPSCRAKVSLRIAPTQDPGRAYELVREHLLAHAPWGVRVEVELDDIGSGFAAEGSGPIYDEARAAFADAWGVDPVDVGIGGSIPFIASFAERFPGAAILVTGIEDPDTRAHAANESLHLGEFERACVAEAVLLERLGRLADTSGE